jgi:hypothetical protein
MSRLVRGHWFRAASAAGPCRYSDCGRPQGEHVESVGEWMDPRHWWRPSLRSPSRCARCARLFGHSTHHGSRNHRQLWRTR